MKFLIIGAGGIGCFYGAKLQLAGHDVHYIARGEHLGALQSEHLVVDHPEFSFDDNVSAFSTTQFLSSDTARNIDVAIVCVKGNHTRSILSDYGNWLTANPETLVLSLQNGIDNEELISNVIGNSRTLGGLAVKIGGHVLSPGHIEATGIAHIIFGPWPSTDSATTKDGHADHIMNTFSAANISVELSHNIQRELWKKLLINNGVNPLSALTGLDTKELTSHPIYRKTVFEIMQETALVARAENIDISNDDVSSMFKLISEFDAIKTSMLVDREKGRELELDTISGELITRGDCYQIPTPLTSLVYALLKN